MGRMLDRIRLFVQGEAPAPPVAGFIGFRITEVVPGRAVVVFEAGPQHTNPMGTLHGGILCDIADAAMGMAYAATLDEGGRAATLVFRFVAPTEFITARVAVDGADRRLGIRHTPGAPPPVRQHWRRCV